jgi:uncharacterized RDD family membrane protein YckC
MDTPPPSPRPDPPGPRDRSWWRRPLADVLDLAAVALVGAGVASLLDLAWTDPGDDAFANLGGGLAALVVGALAGLLAWGSVVLAAGSDGGTPAERLLTPHRPGATPTQRSLHTLVRHVGVVVTGTALAVVVAAAADGARMVV